MISRHIAFDNNSNQGDYKMSNTSAHYNPIKPYTHHGKARIKLIRRQFRDQTLDVYIVEFKIFPFFWADSMSCLRSQYASRRNLTKQYFATLEDAEACIQEYYLKTSKPTVREIKWK